jgi:hypothetical protein
LKDHLCSAGFCQGTEPDVAKVCSSWQDVPKRIERKTDFNGALCNDFDIGKVCSDDTYKANMCPSGMLSSNWCAQYPDACDITSPSYDKCLSDIYQCVATREAYWGYFTRKYPELKRPDYPIFKNSTSVHKAICDADATKFCKDGTTFNVKDVCINYPDLPEIVRNSTSIRTLCNADLDKICTDTTISATVCPDGLNMAFDLTSVLPAGVCNMDDPARTGATADCAHSKDFVTFLAYNGNFCEEFPSLCTPPST